MKTLLQLYNDNPAVYIQMAEQENKEQKVLNVKNDAFFWKTYLYRIPPIQ